jgi:hypothetical protein
LVTHLLSVGACGQLGAAIDAHAAVIRINGAPTVGFEELVGSKTTLRLVNRHHFGFYESDKEVVLQHITTPQVNCPSKKRIDS